MLRIACALSLACALVCASAPARAAEGEWAASAALGARWLRGAGPGPLGELELSRGLSEVWLLLGTLGASHHPERAGAASVLTASLGSGYRLDVLQWVPELDLRLQVYDFLGAAAPRDLHGVQLGASVALRLDHLLTRSWALGIAGQGHAVFTAAGGPALPAVDALLRLRYSLE